MKKIILIVLSLSFSLSFCQTVGEINKTLKIPDSLTYKNEIRIYKWHQTTNGSEIFRMYYDGKKWEYLLYKHYNKLSDNSQSTFEKIILTPQNKDLVWSKIVITDIEFLPDLEDIRYKLKKSEISFDEGEYGINHKKMFAMDGMAYQAFFKQGNKFNIIAFNNYESYLNKYPEVDELIAYSKLISILNDEFGIWK